MSAATADPTSANDATPTITHFNIEASFMSVMD
jgi:hypothetical protein